MANSDYKTIVKDGLWDNNGVFSMLLGMCPTMAMTTSATNGFGMGLATAVVMAASSYLVAVCRNWITTEVRIPVYILIVAAMVTLVDLAMNAWMHELYKVLGLFIPLIVSNCLPLARLEAFAAKQPATPAFLDGLFMGLGFTAVLTTIGIVREVVGSGTVFSQASLLLGPHFAFLETTVIPGYGGTLMMILPPGGFLTLGLLLAVKKRIEIRQRNTGAAVVSVPSHCGA